MVSHLNKIGMPGPGTSTDCSMLATGAVIFQITVPIPGVSGFPLVTVPVSISAKPVNFFLYQFIFNYWYYSSVFYDQFKNTVSVPTSTIFSYLLVPTGCYRKYFFLKILLNTGTIVTIHLLFV
jgi:hypothetical protein